MAFLHGVPIGFRVLAVVGGAGRLWQRSPIVRPPAFRLTVSHSFTGKVKKAKSKPHVATKEAEGRGKDHTVLERPSLPHTGKPAARDGNKNMGPGAGDGNIASKKNNKKRKR